MSTTETNPGCGKCAGISVISGLPVMCPHCGTTLHAPEGTP